MTAAASGRGTSLRRRRKVGLVNLNIPEEYGGIGASVLEECIVGEELAYGCSGIQTALMLNQLAALPMLIAANEQQKEKYFTSLTQEGKIMAYCMTEPDAGSDVAGIKTTAVRKGDKYILNGTKTWITDGPVASYFTVFAKTDLGARHRGMSCFIVERDFPGVSTSKPLEKLGQHAAQACSGLLRECRGAGGEPAGSRGRRFYDRHEGL